MWELVLILLLVCGVVACFLRTYASRQTPWYVWATVFVGWGFALLCLLLIPADVAVALRSTCKEAQRSDCNTLFLSFSGSSDSKPLVPIWETVYWITFALSWLCMPLVQSYWDSGDYRFWKKLRAAVRENLIIYGVALLLCVIFILYMVFGARRLEFEDISGLGMAVSNAWGLIGLIFLMGYGLVEIPRRIWYVADLDICMRRCEYRAEIEKEKLDEAKMELARTLEQVKATTSVAGVDCHEFVAIIMADIPGDFEYRGARRLAIEHVQRASVQDLAILHKRLKRHVHEFESCRQRWNNLLDRAFYLQDCVKAREGPDRVISSNLRPRQSNIRSQCEWVWTIHLRTFLFRSLAVFLAVMSGAVIFGEVSIATQRSPDLSLFSVLIHLYGLPDIVALPFLYLPLCYVAGCAYFSLFQMKVASFYQLLPHRQTDPTSLLFNALLLCRFAPPLGYNYLNLIRQRQQTAFEQVMGDMDVVPFFGDIKFNYYFPIAIALFSLFTLFNAYTRILTCMGDTRFFARGNYTSDEIDEGVQLIQRERRLRERRLEDGESPHDVTMTLQSSPPHREGGTRGGDSTWQEEDDSL